MRLDLFKFLVNSHTRALFSYKTKWEELQAFGFLTSQTSEATEDWQTDRCIGAAFAVMQMLHQSIVVKRQLWKSLL